MGIWIDEQNYPEQSDYTDVGLFDNDEDYLGSDEHARDVDYSFIYYWETLKNGESE